MTYVKPNKAYTSKPLTNFSLAYFNEPGAFIASKIFPIFPVKPGERTGDVYEYGKDAMRLVDTKRAIGGGYNSINLQVEKTNKYLLEDYGLAGDVLEEDLLFAEAPIDAEMDMTMYLNEKLMLDQEKKLADVLTNTGTITQNVTLSGADQWDQYSTSDPFSDIRLAKDTVYASTAKEANTMIIERKVLMTLTDHPLVRGTFPGAVSITHQMVQEKIAVIFGFDTVLVAKGMYNNSNYGAASQPLASVWSDVCIIAYIEQSPKLRTRTLGRTFADKANWTVERYGKTQLGKDAIKMAQYSMIVTHMYYDQVLMDANCAYLIADCLS